MPVGQAVTATIVFVRLRRFRLGRRSGALPRAAAAAAAGAAGAGLTTPSTRATTSSAEDAARSDCDEVRPHQRPGQAGQQLQVLGAPVRGGDEEDEVGRAVGRTEVDRGIQPGEAELGAST